MKDGYQLINVSINAQLLGAFEEEFKFEIDGTNTELVLKVSGEVIATTMSFEIEKLNFGFISTSFDKSTTVSLKNVSLVPVNFVVKSTAPEISFDINEGFLEAEETVDIKVIYKGDEQKVFTGSIYVDIPGEILLYDFSLRKFRYRRTSCGFASQSTNSVPSCPSRGDCLGHWMSFSWARVPRFSHPTKRSRETLCAVSSFASC